jgi:hypothetical protein
MRLHFFCADTNFELWRIMRDANWETTMTPQERQLVDDLFDRLSKLENAPRDPDAAAAIAQGLRRAPNAVYALVQTVLLQDEALKRANARIQELESTGAPEQNQSGGFLDSMRGALFGQSQNQPRGSVPNVPPPEASRPVWNTGQVMPQAGQYNQAPYARSRPRRRYQRHRQRRTSRRQCRRRRIVGPSIE